MTIARMTRAVLRMALLLLLGFHLTNAASAAFRNIEPGMEGPLVEGTDLLTGKAVSSKAAAPGEVVVVTFWATWSERSLELLQDLKRMTRDYANRPFRVIAVNVEGETISSATLEEIRARVKSMELPFPVLVDRGLQAFYAYGVIAVPSTALLNPDGTLRYGPAGYSYTIRDRMLDSTEILLGMREAKATPLAAVEAYRPDVRASRYYHLGLRLADEGVFERAMGHLALAIELDPKFSAPHRLRGEVLLESGNPAGAVDAFRKAVELDSNSVSAWAGLGRALARAGDTTAALGKFEHALRLDESYTPAILDLALCRCRAGEVDPALRMLEKARDLNPLEPAIRFHLGQCYRTARLNAAAVDELHKALMRCFPP